MAEVRNEKNESSYIYIIFRSSKLIHILVKKSLVAYVHRLKPPPARVVVFFLFSTFFISM